eukprot:CAMPEP_0184498132 /NCGR_PEP_ID=MMETSP0113_2-20130426/38183_1 /TAXON_ID=91329 /ORGANISM="Norrisiella sphaerica, Strain BC52" /LENGTH=305 /DNA_ID=CAMNT_0026885511 /DNA_START=341 /DNA_END=1255 /DNA_ORIENTATION=-
MNSACSKGDGENCSNILKRLSSGLLLGVVCTELVPSMVLELHELKPIYLLAPLLGLFLSIIIVRLVDLLSDDDLPAHKLSLHWADEKSQDDQLIKNSSSNADQTPLKQTEHTSYGNTSEENGNLEEQDPYAAYKPVSRKKATDNGVLCWDDLAPAVKLLVNCLLDGLVLGTSLVENFDSTGWSLSAAVTLETCVLGMSFSAGAKSSPWQKFGLNMMIAIGFPLGVIMGLVLTKEFQFNTFFFLAVLGFTTGLLMDIVLEDLMREVYLGETEKSHPRISKLQKLSTGLWRNLAFYIGFMWCLVSET